MADAIIEFAGKLKIELVAEGVERADQAEYLRRRGVRYAQGRLFAKPLPLQEFLAYARKAE
ncbi:MAG: EAL domain-containing protein [Rhodospirillales bacterium]